MKHILRRLIRSWKTRKYMALILVLIIALIGIKLSPDSKEKHEINVQVEDTGEDRNDKILSSERIYQYPVELGFPVEYNYGGNNEVDYLKKTYETVNEDNNAPEPSEDVMMDENNISAAELKISDEGYRKLHASFGDICCTNSGEVSFKINDKNNVGINKAAIMYADKLGYIIDGFNDAKYKFDNNFYGKITYNSTDKEGGVSQLESQYLLIENAVPHIQLSEGDIYETPGSINVEVTDVGKIVSGIYTESIECYINDNKYTPKDIKSIKECRLADNLEVSADTTFTIDFPKDGNYDIQISVSDNCGNTAKLKYYISVVDNKVIIS